MKLKDIDYMLKQATKRELYNELFPKRKAINSNKHYTRATRPMLRNIYKERNYTYDY